MAVALHRLTLKAVRPCISALFRTPLSPAPQLHPLSHPHHSPTLPLPCVLHHQSSSARYLSTVPEPPEYDINLSPHELNEILDECSIVDVRQPEELIADGVIPGAKNIPIGELSAHIENIDPENAVFICKSGVRSLIGISLALQAGFEKPRHLKGGMMAWNEAFHNK